MGAGQETLKFILGLKIKQFRSGNGLSLKELALSSGLSSSYINEIEKGKKYPKVDKLISLARALKISFDDLVSMKLSKDLKPLLTFLESDLFKELPLDLYGISHNNVHELMAQSPEKFASFLMTILEVARNYDMQVEHLLDAALRSYQEMNKNYFPEIEKKMEETVEKFHLPQNEPIPMEMLYSILKKEFNYEIDEEKLNKIEELNTYRSVFKPGNPNKLLINKNLHKTQKAFVLAREIGNSVLKLTEPSATGSGVRSRSFEEVLNDFKASYFSGALLLNKKVIIEDMINFFQNKEFDSKQFFNIMEKYNASTEMFLHRLTQILPEFFKLGQLFFLRINHNNETDEYAITKELHLSQLHNPHGIGLSEHYCRRWITVTLLKELEISLFKGTYERPIVGVQRSKMLDSGFEYFCISIARPSKLIGKVNSCITIGLLINKQFKKTVKFWNDPKVPYKEVAQTCERCGIEQCKERAAYPVIFNKKIKAQKRSKALDDLMASL